MRMPLLSRGILWSVSHAMITLISLERLSAPRSDRGGVEAVDMRDATGTS